MVASNDFVDLIYHNRQTKSATLSDFFSTLLDSDGRKNLPAKYRIELVSNDGKNTLHIYPVAAS
jgi:hypothetical protein